MAPSLEQSLIDIPGALRPVEGAEVGVNRALVKGNLAGMQIVIPPTSVFPEDLFDVYIAAQNQHANLVLSFSVPENYQGGPFLKRIPASLIPEGFGELFYRLNGADSNTLKVLVKTTLPGGVDPQPQHPGHYGLAAPLIDSNVIDGSRDITATVLPWQNMCEGDVVHFQFARWCIPYTVTERDVNQPINFILSKERIRDNGPGTTLLFYRLWDKVKNPASDHSLGQSMKIQAPDNSQLLAPTIIGTDNHNAIDLVELGSNGIAVKVDLTADMLEEDNTIELTWRGELRNGEVLKPVILIQPATATTLTFNIENQHAQRLAGGWANVSFTCIKPDGNQLTSPFAECFLVGNTRRLD
ncbi:hypothetical protein [Pseudomonas nunensis]|uniref:hypothetical protein n=1 Tax=Pseudomonas nunensis TaxID=2961896 RepID=UPI0025AF7086|nr:hypothetical protein [Pseudomonas nunensis]MDN3219218.1 hypothetical protein [Pseudomonas nunensis]